MGVRLRHLAILGPFDWWQRCCPIDGILFIQRHPLEAGRQECTREPGKVRFGELRQHEDLKVRHKTTEDAVHWRRGGHATVLPLFLRLHKLLRWIFIVFLGGDPHEPWNVIAKVIA